jgi:DNA-binding GntR family transcriptional regulator
MSASGTGNRPPTMPAWVLGELRQMIAVGELTPGQPLRQDVLAERLGVSRVPLREALNTLESEGQVDYEPHRGYRVATLSLADMLEVYRIRELLETEAVRATAAQGDPAVVEQLRQAAVDVDAASAAGDLLAMTEANRRFHFVLITASGMPRLERILRTLWDSTETYRFVYYGNAHNRRRVEVEHAGIVDALASADTELLIRLLNEHRGHATDVLGKLLHAPS